MRISSAKFEECKKAAQAASRQAYCPYSKFPVGAAVLDEKGRIFHGCNVENASYGLTICAERNAIFNAVANGAKKIRVVVVYTPTVVPASPCGACRQVINEFGTDTDIICTCDSPSSARSTLSELLPDAFGSNNL